MYTYIPNILICFAVWDSAIRALRCETTAMCFVFCVPTCGHAAAARPHAWGQQPADLADGATQQLDIV